MLSLKMNKFYQINSIRDIDVLFQYMDFDLEPTTDFNVVIYVNDTYKNDKYDIKTYVDDYGTYSYLLGYEGQIKVRNRYFGGPESGSLMYVTTEFSKPVI